MKRELLAATLASVMISTNANACLADGGVDGAIFATPQGTFEVAVAFHQAEQQGLISRSAHANWATVQYLLLQKLEARFAGEHFDITLFDSEGQHFYRLIADGQSIKIQAHEIPKDEYQGVVVTDIDVLVAMVRGQLSFSQAKSLGVITNSAVSRDFEALMAASFI
ncbi:hypothetical protein ACPV5L_07970 [Vibrio astriarenae]